MIRALCDFLRTLFGPQHPWAQTRVLTAVERLAIWERRRGEYRSREVIEHAGRQRNFDAHAAQRTHPAISPRLPRGMTTEDWQWDAL